jgi:hypothetical protein
MKLAHKNIAVEFTYQPEEFNGAAYVEFSTKDLNRFIEESDGADFAKNLVSEVEQAKEEGYYNDTFQISDTDLCVYIFNWMLCDCAKDLFFFDYYGESPFWLFHDISHAENDVAGGVFYVDEEIEEKRIFDGLKALKIADMMEEFKPTMFESIVNDFRNRWSYEIDTKKILRLMKWKKRDFPDLLIFN